MDFEDDFFFEEDKMLVLDSHWILIIYICYMFRYSFNVLPFSYNMHALMPRRGGTAYWIIH